jgi:transposase
MGRSHGGLTTKIHALVDGRGLPIQLHLSEGQASDCRQADPLLGAVLQGSTFLADKAYDSNAIRARITGRGLRQHPRQAQPQEELCVRHLPLPLL